MGRFGNWFQSSNSQRATSSRLGRKFTSWRANQQKRPVISVRILDQMDAASITRLGVIEAQTLAGRLEISLEQLSGLIWQRLGDDERARRMQDVRDDIAELGGVVSPDIIQQLSQSTLMPFAVVESMLQTPPNNPMNVPSVPIQSVAVLTDIQTGYAIVHDESQEEEPVK